MRIYRCPRCRAEDICADAHPTRILDNGSPVPILVCRNCYRASELEFRIACEAAAIPYEPMPIREGLHLLADFYLDRLAEQDDEMQDLIPTKARIQAALDEVRRRLAIQPVS